MMMDAEHRWDSPAMEETVDTSLSIASGASARGNAAVALIEGSTPQLKSETQALLRNRLRAAALILFLGFGAFLIRRLFFEASPLVFFHILVVVVLGAWTVPLCGGFPLSLKQLRVAEAMIFGLPALFFALFEHSGLAAYVATGNQPMIVGLVKSDIGHWFALMVIYGMFIPNTWRRTAAVVAPMVVVPLVVTLATRAQLPAVAAVIDSEILTEMALMLFVGAVCATYGAHIVHSLRRAAFEAKQFGQYRLGERLGAGGMGEVYLAEHQLLKRPCAIKVIRPGKAGDPQALLRFEREVRATAALTHWNSVEVFDYGRTDDGTFYYVMEYLPGMSLADLVERFGPMEPARVLHLIDQTCNALCEAHAAGMVHRDIKPSNIFAAQRGGVYDVAKLLDFGLVKPVVEATSIQVTQEGQLAGSPLFMSPEQATGEVKPDARSDIYSLGAVAYYLLTGRPPFEADNPMKVLIAHARDAVVPPSVLRPEIGADLEQVVMRCLAKDPEQRYACAEELQGALERCEAAGKWTQQDASRWWQHWAETTGNLPPAIERQTATTTVY